MQFCKWAFHHRVVRQSLRVRRFTSAAQKVAHAKRGRLNFLRQTADFIRSAPSPSLALARSLSLFISPTRRKENTLAQIVIKSWCSIKKFASLCLPQGWRRAGRANEILIRPFAQIFSCCEKASNNLPSPGPLSSSTTRTQDNVPFILARNWSRQLSFSQKATPAAYYIAEKKIFRCSNAAPGEKSTRTARNEKLLLTREVFTELVFFATNKLRWSGGNFKLNHHLRILLSIFLRKPRWCFLHLTEVDCFL